MHGLAFGFNGLISHLLLLKIGLMGVGFLLYIYIYIYLDWFELGGGDQTFLYQVDVE